MKCHNLYLRLFLTLVLSFQLSLPVQSLAAAGSRGLIIDEYRKQDVTLWVLSIGVSNYADDRLNLKHADHDAEKIAAYLSTQRGVLFSEVKTRVLVNEKATRENILVAMSNFLGQASGDDVVVIFLAGHGLSDRKTGTYYFVPHNADAQSLIYAGLPMPMFNEALKRLQSHVNKVVLLNDTCHAGAMQMGGRGVTAGEDLTQSLVEANGQYVLSASQAGEESLERDELKFDGEKRGHGVFTYALLEGLRGEAADEEGVVWLSDLFGHVSKVVPRITTGQQHPHSQISGTDLPIFVMAGGETSAGVGTTGGSASLPAGNSAAVDLEPGSKGGSRTWLWLLLGAAAAGGGAAAVVGGGGGDTGGSQTGSLEYDIPIP